jgi:predicted TIM-barrel fold metal-dependent hydrolase
MNPLQISRRQFLSTTAVAATGLATGCQTASPPRPADHIDAHVHVWTPETSRYPLDASFKPSDMKPASFTPEELFAHTKPNGVARIVLIQMSYYRFDNAYMLETIRRHSGVFSGVAIIDEHAARLRERMQEIARMGVRGFRISPGRQTVDAWLGSPGMTAMWAAAADLGLAMCPLINTNALPGIEKMCERFPATRVVIDHFARIGVDGQIRDADVATLCGLARFKYTHVKTSAFYALGKKQAPYTDLGPMIQRLRDAFGAQRLMWASDCPFQVQGDHTYANSIALIRDRLDFLSPDDREWMLRKTAERVFFS